MARILVVGAGIVGLSVARAALRRGHAVTLIEQGPVPNPHSASFDQHRMIRMHYGAAEGYTRMVGSAFAAWDTLWQDLGVRHFVDCGALAVSTAAGDYADQSQATFRRLAVPHERQEEFDEGLARGAGVIGDFGPYLRDAEDYRPLRMQVGYYVMDDSRRFALHRSGRRIVVTNCDGQMFKFGPLIGERIVAAIDGERSFDEVARWIAG